MSGWQKHFGIPPPKTLQDCLQSIFQVSVSSVLFCNVGETKGMKKFRFQTVSFPGLAGAPEPETEAASGLSTKKLKSYGQYAMAPSLQFVRGACQLSRTRSEAEAPSIITFALNRRPRATRASVPKVRTGCITCKSCACHPLRQLSGSHANTCIAKASK